jgi:putative transposase
MLFAFLYSWLRLLLDVADIRLRVRDSEAELLLLRHQLRVVRRQVKRPRFEPADRAIMAALSRLVSRAAVGSILVQPETVHGWHRELVRRKWAAFGRLRGPGRPRLDDEVVGLILRMAKDNPKWGCVRIHGELLKVGHQVSITAIRNLLHKRRVPGSPTRSGASAYSCEPSSA